MLKLKLQYFGYMMQRANSLEKALMLGKIEGRRRGGRQRMKWSDGITYLMTWVWASSRSWWWTQKPVCSLFGCKESDRTEPLNKLVVKLVLFPIRNGNGDIYRALAGNEICALRRVLAKYYLKFQSVLQKQVLFSSPHSLKRELQTCLFHTRKWY